MYLHPAMKRKLELFEVNQVVKKARLDKARAFMDLRTAALSVVVQELKHQSMLAKIEVSKAEEVVDKHELDLNADYNPVKAFVWKLKKVQVQDKEREHSSAINRYIDVVFAFSECQEERREFDKLYGK